MCWVASSYAWHTFLNKELTLFLKCREFWCCKYKIFIDLVITEQWKGEKQKRELVHLQWPLCPSMKVVIPVNSLTSLLLPELLESSLTTSPFITELCHLDCSSRSKLLEGSFLLFFHLANRTSRNAKSEWTPVSYLQNNMGHLRAMKCLCHCFSLVASEVVFSFVATYFCACIIPLPPTAQQRLWGEQKTLFLTQNATKSQRIWQSFADMCSQCPAVFRPAAA